MDRYYIAIELFSDGEFFKDDDGGWVKHSDAQAELEERDRLLVECFGFIKNTPHATGPKEQVDLLNKLLPIYRKSLTPKHTTDS